MNIIIHGAVNGSNFGDCLYAQMYNEYIKEIDGKYNVFFLKDKRFGASEHLKKCSDIRVTRNIKDMDILVYMPGGYFGEGPNLYRRIKQYLRFFKLGERFIKKNKTILVSGVGGESLGDNFLRRRISDILKNSRLITTRNNKTKNLFESCFDGEVVALFDPILRVRKMKMCELPDKIKRRFDKGKKKIFLHVYAKNWQNAEYKKIVIPAINRYIKENDACVFVGTDYIPKQDISLTDIYKEIEGEKCVYRYTNPVEMCSFLSHMDLIITPKLHVGAVSCAMGKSVISFAIDSQKTGEFYKDIGYASRSVSMKDSDSEFAYNQITKYADEPIVIPEELFAKAMANYEMIKEAILDIQNEERNINRDLNEPKSKHT